MPYRLVAIILPIICLNSAWADDEKPPARAKPTVAIQPEPLTSKPGRPLSERALVPRPAPLKGLVSWSLETRRHRGNFSATALSPDGKLLATGGLDGTVRLWDTETGKLVRALIGHNSYVYGLDFSPDGTALTSSGSFDATVRLWDVRSGMPLRVLKESPTYLVQTAWSPDGKTILAAGGESGTLSRWNAPTGNYQTKFEFGKPVQGLAWAPDSHTAAVVVAKLPLHIWDADTNKIQKKLGSETTDFRCAAFSPDGKTLAAGTSAQTILYDAASGAEKGKLDGHAQAVAWSSDGKLLATAMTSAGAIKVWDVAEAKLLKTIPGVAYTLHFAPDDKQLIGGDYTNFAVYSCDEMRVLRQYEIAGTGPPLWYAGKPIVTGIGTTKISLWDQATGKFLRAQERVRRRRGRGLVVRQQDAGDRSPRQQRAALGLDNRKTRAHVRSPYGGRDHRRVFAGRQVGGLRRPGQTGAGLGRGFRKDAAQLRRLPGRGDGGGLGARLERHAGGRRSRQEGAPVQREDRHAGQSI